MNRKKTLLEKETESDILVNKEFHDAIVKLINRTIRISFNNEIYSLIDDRVSDAVEDALSDRKYSKEEAKKIVEELKDEIDKMISNQIKHHLSVLANFILDQFKT